MKAHAKTSRKDSAITFRISPLQKHVLSEAAKIRQKTLTSFVLDEAFQTAQEVLTNQVIFRLNDVQWKLFNEVLDRPAQLNEKLSNLLNQPSILDQQ